MKVTARALLPLLPLLAACRVDVEQDGDEGNDEATTGSEADTGTADGEDTTTTTTSTTTGETTTATSAETGPSTDTGQEEQFCGLREGGPDEPWFELSHWGDSLVDGGQLHVECGGQGSFMIAVRPSVGGFIPDSDYVSFHVELDVDGGFNIGNGGHFASGDFDIFVGCCEYEYGCYYLTYSFFLLPPDGLQDITAIHGQTGTLSVTMTGPGGPVEQVLDVEMWSVDDGSWEFCNYAYGTGGYGELEPLPIGGPGIPE